MKSPSINSPLAGLLLLASLAGCHPNPVNVSAPSTGEGGPINVAVNTERARSLNAEGFSLIQDKKYQQAEDVLRRAIDADPMFGPAHNNLGLCDYRLNRLYDAAWDLEKAGKLMPHQPEPRNNLGLVMEKAGRLTDAMQNYTLASQMDPDNAEYLGNLARVRVRLDLRDDETCRVLESLIAHDTRQQWLDWARFTLIRMRASKAHIEATSQPSTLPSK